MTQQKPLTLSIDNDHIAWLTIDVPDESMNVLKMESIHQLGEILTELENRQDEIKGLIIHSGKPDSFIAGADVRMIDRCRTKSEAKALVDAGHEVFNRLSWLPVTTAVAIHGVCLGGGLELSLACDYRICTDADTTRLGLPEVQLGILPGAGGTQRLPRLIGLIPALDIILTGKQVRARKAKKLGLVDDAVPLSILMDTAKLYAQKSKPKRRLTIKEFALSRTSVMRRLIISQAEKKAQQKARHNYPAIGHILDVINYGLANGLKRGLDYEIHHFAELAVTPESQALRSIFFATTEMKKETGSDALPIPVNGVGVLGGGLMGAGIAYVSGIKAGAAVRIKDVSNDGILHALRYSHQLLEKQCKRRILTPAQRQKKMMQLSGGTDFTGFHHADVVVEAVFEDLALKQQMVADIEMHANEKTIFATNTSSLPIHQIAEKAARPENIVGLHYFSPVEKMPLAEIIPHAGTSDQTIATVVDFSRKQGKTPIVVRDSAGFYVNRILVPYIYEAIRILLDGEPMEVIDNALMNAGFPVGPVSLLDEVGMDVGAKIMPVLVAEHGERFKGPDIVNTMLKNDRKGRKNGRGFYSYKGKKKTPDKSVYRLLNVTPEASMKEQDISLRCLFPMLNEAVRCLDEGVIRNARDGDIGAIFGIGFPPFTGGPFRYMEQYGLVRLVEKMNEFANLYGDRFAPCDGLVSRAQEERGFY
ncbi:fatty acid oxidation complex subunit alpha FadJ [Vibrio albus]|uniref:enoyl-CoA hydratase n=1 Tax=Vibrio albus TaxID=2200953 RepID=A0A2U3BD67_9VIBR|nr:fatty acid oxidation complex subunit alpha FadJ [Vibrio albus]